MTRSRRFVRISLTSARWLLPWLAVLFVSVTLAYAVTGAVHGSAHGDRPPDVRDVVTLSTREASTSTALERLQEAQSRAASRDVLLDNAAVEQSSWTRPTGGMSNASLASTGSASP